VQLRRAQAVIFPGAVPGTLASAIDQAREAFERAAPDDVRTRSYAKFIVGHAARDLGRITEAVSEFAAGLTLFEHVDRNGRDAGFALPIYVSLGAWRSEAYAALGEFQAAVTSGDDALQMATDIRHASSLATANMFLGIIYVIHGEPDAALPFLKRGLAIATEHDLHLGMVRAAAHLGHALVTLGERDRGLELLAQARARSAAGFTAPHVTGYGAVTASAYLTANCPTEARTDIQQGLAAAAERNARGYQASLLRLEAEVLAKDDVVGARERLQAALTLAAELRMRPEIAHCHLGLGKLYRSTGKQEQARGHLAIATTMYREMNMLFWLEQTETDMRASD
jgi:tetratricopeptide (TPR) repeat protein